MAFGDIAGALQAAGAGMIAGSADERDRLQREKVEALKLSVDLGRMGINPSDIPGFSNLVLSDNNISGKQAVADLAGTGAFTKAYNDKVAADKLRADDERAYRNRMLDITESSHKATQSHNTAVLNATTAHQSATLKQQAQIASLNDSRMREQIKQTAEYHDKQLSLQRDIALGKFENQRAMTAADRDKVRSAASTNFLTYMQGLGFNAIQTKDGKQIPTEEGLRLLGQFLPELDSATASLVKPSEYEEARLGVMKRIDAKPGTWGASWGFGTEQVFQIRPAGEFTQKLQEVAKPTSQVSSASAVTPTAPPTTNPERGYEYINAMMGSYIRSKLAPEERMNGWKVQQAKEQFFADNSEQIARGAKLWGLDPTDLKKRMGLAVPEAPNPQGELDADLRSYRRRLKISNLSEQLDPDRYNIQLDTLARFLVEDHKLAYDQAINLLKQ